jgi:3-phenylpropionate/trans-cinnamate dioxygenase ferredoxin subunit
MPDAIHTRQDTSSMTDIKLYQWHFVADSEAALGFGSYDMVQAEVGDKTICIARFKDQLFAFQSKCPHAGAKMVMGYIDAQGNAVCPLHRFKFSLKNGYNVTGEGYNMRTYPLEIREDGIYVGFRN